MRRPFVVSVIACYFLVAGIYLCSIAAMMWSAPRALETIGRVPYVSVLASGTPYLPLVVGIVWTITAWGLLRLRNWARWVTMLMLCAGSAWAAATMLTVSVPFEWQVAYNWSEIAIRAGAAVYLSQSSRVLAAFTAPKAS